ncbi:ribonuclease D [Haemophilus influenzae]|uniref:Ribonuclease D n=1 Tax=Haemophilus influenzae TaxID=727 RepID=A0A2X1QNA4_HAEIF|nr:ribonuclease D [Haemophilus influenzae]
MFGICCHFIIFLKKELAKTPWEQAVRDDCELVLAKTHKLQERDSEKAYLDIPKCLEN